MDNNSGWIALHRKLLDWEWYGDTATRSVFIDLLLNASHNSYKWRGISVNRGQTIFGRKEVSRRLGLSEQNIRTAITKLKSTSEITIKSTNKFSIITIDQLTNQPTNQQTSNQQLTTTNNITI